MSNSTEIHAPYHFVPLSKWVYMPEWSHLVSHDVPLKEGYSGVIDYTVTNASPLCVGGSQEKMSSPSVVKWARDGIGNPVIPNTSLKGAIRNVLEIASFGKFNAVDNQHFSFRDISSSKSHYLKSIIKPNDVISGWIKYDSVSQRWQFKPCRFAKVKHSEIKLALKKNMLNEQSVEKKYQTLPLTVSATANISDPVGVQKNIWAENLNNGETSGHFVFTNKRIVNGKRENYEFSYFFFDEQKKVQFDDIKQYVANLFENHNEKQVTYLKKNSHPELGIPVFALVSKGNNPKLHSLGFAKMPRVSYKHSVQQLVNQQHKAHSSEGYFDLAELMFGTLRDEGYGLKGRVTISDAITMMQADELYLSNKLVLNSPKATFCPAYLEQEDRQNRQYHDYDGNSKLSGYKRYISQTPEFERLSSTDTASKDSVSSVLELAPIDSSFFGKIVFHNLHPVELGALLWALELSGNRNYYHQLGHGKPYGAGAVQIDASLGSVRKNDGSDPLEKEALLGLFQSHMNEQYPDNRADGWLTSPQLTNLLAISHMFNNGDIDTRYMSIDNGDFQKAKTNAQVLEPFKGLDRAEYNGFANKVYPLSFGQGRLAGLVDQTDNWHTEIVAENAKLKQQQQQQEQEARQAQLKAEKMASMSAGMQAVETLKESVLSENDVTVIPPLLRAVITEFLNDNVQYDQESARVLYGFLREQEFHKKPRKRAGDQKKQLAQLREKYKIEV